MFTGLIQDIGRVESVEAGADGARLRVSTSLAPEIEVGDSVAVDGVCLTATRADAAGFEAEAMNQTLKVTALGGLEAGDRVNLEPALKASDRLGGHIVQGHVDGVGEVVSVEADGFARRLRVALAPELMRYVVRRARSRSAGSASPWRSWGTAGQRHRSSRRRWSGRSLGKLRRRQAERRVRRSCQVRGAAGGGGALSGTIGWKGASVSQKTEAQRTGVAGQAAGETAFATIEEAIEEIRRGRMVVVCDGEDRENEGDLVMAAQFATPEAINFMAKEARG